MIGVVRRFAQDVCVCERVGRRAGHVGAVYHGEHGAAAGVCAASGEEGQGGNAGAKHEWLCSVACDAV